MLNPLLRKWENPNRPLLGPNVRALEFWGLLLPKLKYKRYFYIVMHILVTTFIASEYAVIWSIKSDLNLLIINVKITLFATISICKATSFLYWQEKWKSVIEYVTLADLAQRNTTDVSKINLIKDNTKYARRIVNLYWSISLLSVMIVVFHPIFKYILSESYRRNIRNGSETYMEVVSSWMPFDKTTVLGYLVTLIWQSYATIYGGCGWTGSFDSNAIVIMIFFKGELELLRRDCADVFGEEGDNVSDDEAMDRIRECHRRHVELIKYARVFDFCLSPVMFIYMLVSSVMFCVSAYQITFETNLIQRFLVMEYLLFVIAQLFMYCWHSNDVFYTSQSLSLGPYQSSWWGKITLRRELHILIAQFREVVVFSVGPFSKLTVSTFISILRGAYSYYTLLSKSEMK